MGLYEFKVTLIYRASSRAARATQRNPVSITIIAAAAVQARESLILLVLEKQRERGFLKQGSSKDWTELANRRLNKVEIIRDTPLWAATYTPSDAQMIPMPWTLQRWLRELMLSVYA